MDRGAVLLETIAQLQRVGITVNDLLNFVLTQKLGTVYRDVLANTKTILATLYNHPATSTAVHEWAHDTMRAHYAELIAELAHSEHGLHFSAVSADPDQVRNFRVHEIAAKIQEVAPDLWSLVYTMLRGPDQTGANAGRSSAMEGGEALMDVDDMSDSEADYWPDDLEDVLQNRSNSTNRLSSGRQPRSASAEMLAIFRTVTVTSILLQSFNQRCNALQSAFGIFMHTCNAPEKLIKVLNRMGMSVPLSSIHRAILSLSGASAEEIRQLGQTLLTSYAYDNMEFQLNIGISTVEKPGDGLLHLTTLLWERSELNLHASDPRPFDVQKTIRHLYSLHRGPEPAHSGALSRRGRFRSWFLMRLLFQHGPAALKELTKELEKPDSVETIPVKKLRHVPLRTMDLNQSKVSGNIAAILDMFAQAGVGDGRADRHGQPTVDISEFVTVIHGDLGTYERVLSARRRRAVEKTPYDRLQSVVCVAGLFHFKMAAADAIWRLLMVPAKAQGDAAGFRGLVGKLRPRESSKLVHAKFRDQHQLIGHVLTLLALDAWRSEVEKRTGLSSLEEWAASKPSLEAIQDIADTVVREYIEGEGLNLFQLGGQSSDECDEVRINTMRTLHYLLLYEELSYAMNEGEIGRVETLVMPWVRIFRATGKHKYGTYTLRFMHALYLIYPDGLRHAIRYNMLVNPTDKSGESRAVDWIIEFQNLLTKVTYGGEGSNFTKTRIIQESPLVKLFRASHENFETNFALSGLTNKHARKNMTATFTIILAYLKNLHPNEYEAGRGAPYRIPDALMRGAEIISGEGRGTDREMEDGEEEGHPDEGLGEEMPEEDLDNEMTLEDLVSVTDMLF